MSSRVNELRDPTFRDVDLDFGSAALGMVTSAFRIEVWEDANGTQHFLGQAYARPARESRLELRRCDDARAVLDVG
jgi:hypothetical protein